MSTPTYIDTDMLTCYLLILDGQFMSTQYPSLSSLLYGLKKLKIKGRLGGSVAEASDFGSRH